MATYITIADSEIDPESAGTATLFSKLRNNPLAIQQDDVSAPDVVYAISAGSAGTAAYATSAGDITGQGALATLDDITASEVDYSGLIGLGQIPVEGTFTTTSVGTFVSVHKREIIKPAGAANLIVQSYLSNDSSQTTFLRITTTDMVDSSSANSGNQQHNNATPTLKNNTTDVTHVGHDTRVSYDLQMQVGAASTGTVQDVVLFWT